MVAGVTFKDESKLIEYRIKDSKKITPKRRVVLAKKIKEIALDFEMLIIPANDIDDLRKVMTLNEIEVNAFIRVIKKLKPKVCYVDSADVNEERFKRDILSGLIIKPNIISKHKADEIYPVVGAASILAKTVRDEHICRIAKELQNKLSLPLGSGYPADAITQKFLRTWVETYNELPPHVRISWSTAQKIIKESKIKKLDEF